MIPFIWASFHGLYVTVLTDQDGTLHKNPTTRDKEIWQFNDCGSKSKGQSRKDKYFPLYLIKKSYCQWALHDYYEVHVFWKDSSYLRIVPIHRRFQRYNLEIESCRNFIATSDAHTGNFAKMVNCSNKDTKFLFVLM